MTEEAKFECTDMFLMNSLHDLYTSMQFEDQRILTKTHLKNNFTISKERSSSEDEHKDSSSWKILKWGTCSDGK
jgi:hypothetical protein